MDELLQRALKVSKDVKEGKSPDNIDDLKEEDQIKTLTEQDEEFMDPDADLRDEPKEDEPEIDPIKPASGDEEEAPEIVKELVGNTEDTFFYMISVEDDNGEVKDLNIVDQESVTKFSAREHGIDFMNVPEFLFKAIKELQMENIEFAVFDKYLFPYVFEDEDEPEDEEALEDLENLEDEPEQPGSPEQPRESKVNEQIISQRDLIARLEDAQLDVQGSSDVNAEWLKGFDYALNVVRRFETSEEEDVEFRDYGVFDKNASERKRLMEMKITDHENNEFEVYVVDDGTLDTVIDVAGREFTFDKDFAALWRDAEGNLSEEGLRELALGALSGLGEDDYNELVARSAEEKEKSKDAVLATQNAQWVSGGPGSIDTDAARGMESKSKVNEGLESHADSVLEDAEIIKGQEYEWDNGLAVYDDKDVVPIMNALAKSGEFGPTYYEGGKIHFQPMKGPFGESKVFEGGYGPRDTVKLVKREDDEWAVEYYVDGKYSEAKTYYTDDKGDAEDTMADIQQRIQAAQDKAVGEAKIEETDMMYADNLARMMRRKGKSEDEIRDVLFASGMTEDQIVTTLVTSKDESKTNEATMGVDYIKKAKAGIKDAQAAMKDKDYDKASEILDDVADDCADGAKAAKKMKIVADDKAAKAAEKEKGAKDEPKVEEAVKTGLEFNYEGKTWKVIEAGETESKVECLTGESKGDTKVIDNKLIKEGISIDEKSAPVCKKCDKAHWPFQKCGAKDEPKEDADEGCDKHKKDKKVSEMKCPECGAQMSEEEDIEGFACAECGLVIESAVSEDMKEITPGQYEVVHHDGHKQMVSAESPYAAKKKGEINHPDSPVSTTNLVKSTGDRQDVHFRRDEAAGQSEEDIVAHIQNHARYRGIISGQPKYTVDMDGESYSAVDTRELVLKVCKDKGIPCEEKKVAEKYDPEQLRMGTEIEMEHTDDTEEARKIAMDHLDEMPDYYTKLKKMEAGACDEDVKEREGWYGTVGNSLANYGIMRGATITVAASPEDMIAYSSGSPLLPGSYVVEDDTEILGNDIYVTLDNGGSYPGSQLVRLASNGYIGSSLLLGNEHPQESKLTEEEDWLSCKRCGGEFRRDDKENVEYTSFAPAQNRPVGYYHKKDGGELTPFAKTYESKITEEEQDYNIWYRDTDAGQNVQKKMGKPIRAENKDAAMDQAREILNSEAPGNQFEIMRVELVRESHLATALRRKDQMELTNTILDMLR
jgi:hypothetical protein